LRDLATLQTPRVADIEIERAIADEKLAEERQQSLVLRAPLAGSILAEERVDDHHRLGNGAALEPAVS